jgi:hypothetical protein
MAKKHRMGWGVHSVHNPWNDVTCISKDSSHFNILFELLSFSMLLYWISSTTRYYPWYSTVLYLMRKCWKSERNHSSNHFTIPWNVWENLKVYITGWTRWISVYSCGFWENALLGSSYAPSQLVPPFLERESLLWPAKSVTFNTDNQRVYYLIQPALFLL